jgi:hypothetical protein
MSPTAAMNVAAVVALTPGSCMRRRISPDASTRSATQRSKRRHLGVEEVQLARAIAEILRPHVGRVALANPQAVRGKNGGRAKTDKIDARSLAKLLASGFLPEVWAPDAQTAALRNQLARRRQLVKQRTREKNQVHAVLARNLKGKPPVSDLFGTGAAWLAEQQLPAHEREMADPSGGSLFDRNKRVNFRPDLTPDQARVPGQRRRRVSKEQRPPAPLCIGGCSDSSKWVASGPAAMHQKAAPFIGSSSWLGSERALRPVALRPRSREPSPATSHKLGVERHAGPAHVRERAFSDVRRFLGDAPP